MKKNIIKGILFVLQCSFFFVIYCSCVHPFEINYTPPVVFSGYINGDYANLSGNRYWKNSCLLINDTLRMYFYSYDFKESNNIRNGDLLRLDIYPGESKIIGISRTLFHLARYYDINSSYTITPKDTLNSSAATVQMSVLLLGNCSDQAVSLDEIYVRSMPESGTKGAFLEIKNGRIEGVIE